MHYTGTVYRPPSEANSVLLQVTVGCSHGKCRFCHGYRDLPFRAEPIEQIVEDLEEVRDARPDATRIHLLSGDAFALSYDELMAIAAKIHELLPKVEVISSMAGVINLKDKSLQQLKNLKEAGYKYLYVGMESGLDEVLVNTEKGSNVNDTLEQLHKLEESGIKYDANYLLGLAGSGNSEKNALATAELVNKLKPNIVAILSLTLFPDTKMYHDRQNGSFKEASELERTKEFKTFIENLNIRTRIAANHVTMGTPIVGDLPQDKEKILNELQNIIDTFDESWYRMRRNSIRSV
ncbi:MAG: radical SAM protein [Oscillospiraceae bacterium]|nr:radical SAM protein [Oscillospiraceae bacterium]